MKYIEICPISKSKIFGFFLDFIAQPNHIQKLYINLMVNLLNIEPPLEYIF